MGVKKAIKKCTCALAREHNVFDDAGHYNMERCVSPINDGGDAHWKCRR